MEWVSVMDERPEVKDGDFFNRYSEYVLVYTWIQGVARWDYQDEVWVDCDSNVVMNVSHWMKLPEPPK